MREDLIWLLGEGWYSEKIESGFETQMHTITAFWWFKGDLISQWIPKFYLCDESNPINPQCGKISANFYISPPHPPHPQFYPQKWWKFRYTSWLTKKNRISIDLRGAQVNNTWVTIQTRVDESGLNSLRRHYSAPCYVWYRGFTWNDFHKIYVINFAGDVYCT